ncbi:MAG TPA: PPC domain-containing protein [Kofleriaceae bacterium]|jgi:hypothetical protein
MLSVADQTAQVGTELVVMLAGSDAKGSRLAYRARSDLPDLDSRSTLTEAADGTGVFRWTPLATDLGVHPFDFTAATADASTTVTVSVTVESALGPATSPRFTEPAGAGTTLDLEVSPCLELAVVVDDADSPNVAIAEAPPLLDGAKLTSTGDLSAHWHWCPSAAEIADGDATLVLTADDGDHVPAELDYVIVLRDGSGSACPGAPPVIAHEPADAVSVLALPLAATITADAGVKGAPLVYFSTSPFSSPPDFASLAQLPLTALGGDAFTVDVPNPVAAAAPGSTVTLSYLFSATDAAPCPHTTLSPVYAMQVTAGGTDRADTCAPCTADAQCAAAAACVPMGEGDASYCLPSCLAGCPTGTTCAGEELVSVSGADISPCVPDAGTCAPDDAPCVDDGWEINDTRADAVHATPLAAGLYSLVSCPSPSNPARMNDDWFKLVLPAAAQLDLGLTGGDTADLDLHLYTSSGGVLGASAGATSDEALSSCLGAATYYVKVNGYGHARDEYELSVATADCEAP